MNIALVGYGKMGKEVEQVIADTSHEIVSVSFSNSKKLDIPGIKKADVAIDFTAPEIVMSNIEAVTKLGVKMVVGTTGWYTDLKKVQAIVKKNKAGLIYGSNFSIGANIFFQVVDFASGLLGKFTEYDVAGFEMHHISKKDSPSGTAKKIASILLRNIPSKKRLQTQSLNRQIEKDELHFASLRTGRHFGYHQVLFDSSADEILLSHNVHNRRGFAQGALFAAEFIKSKKGVFSFEEVFQKEVNK